MCIQNFKEKIASLGIEYSENCSLARFSTFKVGGRAVLAVFPKNKDQLCEAIVSAIENSIKYEVIGRGSNLFFCDGIFDGALVITSGIKGITQNGDLLGALCGTPLCELSRFAAQMGYTGLEFAYGIPGSVGGAVYMNAGAYGSEIKDVLVESEAFDKKNGEIVTVREHGFGYRRSIYSENDRLVCLEARFMLARGDKREIKSRMKELMCERRLKQPLEYASAGSYFKRPEGYFAAKLIDDCGLKGLSVGGAAVSEKHAGFIINKGGATAKDLLALEDIVKERVLENFGIVLEREVKYIF